MNITVAHHCRIRKNSIYRDGQLMYLAGQEPFNQFSETAYRHFNISYPKFHKMDSLSKLGLLAADTLLDNNGLDKILLPAKTGVILSNKSSSLDTDIKYFNMVKTGVASPAVFVYSLPNIVIGEICIRNGIKGENTFFISGRYDIPSQVDYINNLFNTGVIDACICGWVELIEENYDAFLYLAQKTEPAQPQMPHTIDTIKKIYQNI
jgi:hypothetical protein